MKYGKKLLSNVDKKPNFILIKYFNNPTIIMFMEDKYSKNFFYKDLGLDLI